MKNFTIIAGVNGVGKSSFTGVLQAERKDLGTLIDVDKLAVKFKNPIAGAREGIKIIDKCFETGNSLTQETTLSGSRIKQTIKLAKNLGYKIQLYYIGLDTSDESILRIKSRVLKGGHNIPDELVLKRFADRFIDLNEVLPFCDIATFFDNNNGFVKVAKYKNGSFLEIIADHCNWIEDFRRFITYNK